MLSTTTHKVLCGIVALFCVQGHHGYLASNPKMNAVFVAAGRGIKRGAKLGVIENTKVAPTIAKLLGQSFPAADIAILSEILSSNAN